ncbi:DegV family protein [Virgibacillus xinjiangensis]|uniref:DegV family protein n=1 Tax=Virgibacillus xinjiangensis TaxID=393090 RepID=A0ABV7CSA8_9BACI
MNIQLMTDSGADIPKRLREEIPLTVAPLYLHFHDGQYRTGVDMDLENYHKKVEEAKELPRSAAPSPSDFYEAFKEADPAKPILMLSLSKGLSSTYENAVMGKNMLLEEEPERRIEVINTKTASCGIALQLHEAARKIREGLTFEELVPHMEERIEQTATLFVLKTLENLIIGGRLDKVKGTIAKTLNIKLLMQASEQGTIEVTEKVRGDKKSIRRFIDQIGEHITNANKKVICMSHCNAGEKAQKVIEEISGKYSFDDAYLMDMGPLIATYGGEGALVISFYKN